MHTKPFFFLLLLAAGLAPFAGRAQDQPVSAETRLRSVLRDTMGQLRDAQNQVVTLQVAQAQSDKDKADLQAKLDAVSAQLKSVSDQAAADKATSEKSIQDFNSQIADQKGQIDRLNDGLKQWKDAYNQAAQLAASKEAARAQYAMQAALLQRTVDDRETKNLALYKLGHEILTRYEQFGLGDAIEAKEPFVGLTRVTLENLVQDYKNKLLDQAITTGRAARPTVTPKPAPPNSPAEKPDPTVAAKPANET